MARGSKYALRTHSSQLCAFAATPFGLREAWVGKGVQPAELPAVEQPDKPDKRLEFIVEMATGNRPLGEVLKELAALPARHGVTDVRIEREDPPAAPHALSVATEPFRAAVKVPLTPFDGDGEPMTYEVQGLPWALAFEMAAQQAKLAVRYESGRILVRSRDAWHEHFRCLEEAVVHVQDLDRGALSFTVRGACARVSTVAFACSGRLLVVYGLGGDLMVLRVEDGSTVLELPEGSVYNTGPCSFSADGWRLAARTSNNRAVNVVTVGDPAAYRTIPLQGEIEGVSLSPDGALLLVGEWGQSTHLYELQPFRELASWREFSGSASVALRTYEWTPDGHWLLSLAYGGANIVRDANGAKVPLPPDASEMRSSRTPHVASDNRRVLCRDRDDPNRYTIWDLASFEPLQELPPYVRNPDFERLTGWAQDLLGLDRAPPHPVSQPEPQPAVLNPFAMAPEQYFPPSGDPSFAPGGERAVASWGNAGICVWERRRPEWWWGIAWLPEFWLTVVFGLALVWSLRRDWKTLRGKKFEAKAEMGDEGVLDSAAQVRK